MNKDEFLKQLNQALHALDMTERARTVQYYREILEDRIEDGLTEEEAVAEMEPIDDIVAGILSDTGSRGKLKPSRSAWNISLLILGSPIWLTLLIALGAVLLAMYAVAWSIIIALFSVVAALGVGILAGIFALFLYWSTFPMTGLFLLGAGFVCAALGIALFFPSCLLAKWLIQATTAAGKAIWHRIFHRKEDLT